MILVAVIGCTSHESDARYDTAHAQRAAPETKRYEPVMIGSNDSICEPVSRPLPDAAVLGHWFAADLRGHRTTFGFRPPDSASVKLVPDLRTRRTADKAVLSQFEKWNRTSKSPHLSPKSIPVDSGLAVYRARNIYAVVDSSEVSCGGDRAILPIVWFFDTKWRYLGSRSN